MFSYSPHKDVWESYIAKEKEIRRFVFSTRPSETALFSDAEKPQKKTNVTTFFENLKGDTIQNITLAGNDRFMTILFDSGLYLLFQIFGNKPNVFLIKDKIILESFKENEKYKDCPQPESRAPAPQKELTENLSARQAVIRTDPKFPRHLIGPVIQEYGLDEKPAAHTAEIVQNLTQAMRYRPEFRVLGDGNLCLIPTQLLPLPNLKITDNVNEAIRFVYYHTSKKRRFSSRVQSVEPKMGQTATRLRSAIRQLEQAGKGTERSERYEKLGHILMAHAHQQPDPGTESVTLPDFYDSDNPVAIPVKAGLSMAENAQRYYEKSAKALRNVEESKRRLVQAQKDLEKLERLRESLGEVTKIYEFDDWIEKNRESLSELGILGQQLNAGTGKTSRPYRRVQIENYEVLIGKNAKSNDVLTTDAHKEDIWLHARGVAGSHVVIRMNNQKEMPPESVIVKAASLAAWNSKARGSKLVPVIFTKRKYVTKPKGAPAGTVRVQREDVKMVKPQKTFS